MQIAEVYGTWPATHAARHGQTPGKKRIVPMADSAHARMKEGYTIRYWITTAAYYVIQNLTQGWQVPYRTSGKTTGRVHTCHCHGRKHTTNAKPRQLVSCNPHGLAATNAQSSPKLASSETRAGEAMPSKNGT